MILKMEFLNIEFLWLLIAVPLLVLWYYYTGKYKSNTLNFSNSEAFSDSRSFVVLIEPILRIFRMIALSLLIIALARPQVIDMSTRVKNNQGIDIVMAIDVSASMLAKDLKPNRLEALKDVAANFIRSRTTDRIGLVEYAGESYTKTPITSDKSIILRSLKEIEYNTIIEGGTAIGMGLATSVNRIKDSKAISKVVILLTDGVNNSGFIDPLTAAELANEFGIKIYTIGLGTNGMALSPIGIDSRGKFNYANAKVEIDEKLLNEIADLTGGKYFRATNNSKLKEIYDDIDKLERSDIEEFKYYNVQEKYRIFLLPALILIGLEMILKFTLFRSFI
ncbi:MAG: VWA domain-containing protein [Bacteroidota bacterium]|jgi:Ca-activated chloride channel family protein|nr:VWA domain-containing protein [Bacteroidota bacterium]|tara:strand:- start:901 stop:1905 length:1005 start_codon:yes stop_codon:yes gene_type:complete